MEESDVINSIALRHHEFFKGNATAFESNLHYTAIVIKKHEEKIVIVGSPPYRSTTITIIENENENEMMFDLLLFFFEFKTNQYGAWEGQPQLFRNE